MKKTKAQTPAPKKERIYGSAINKPKSSKSIKSAEKIKFSDKTIESIKNKVYKHNKKHPEKKISVPSAKAVVRRGMGAYSKSHRPTISGGKSNSRVAWGLARLNAFIYKIVNGKSKSGKYTQDDDLIEELGYKVAKMKDGGNTNNSINNKDENKKRAKKQSIIEEAISYISRGIEATNKKQSTSISEQKIKNLENQLAFDFAIKKGIWNENLKNLPRTLYGGGNENSLYYDENTGTIYKSNNLFNASFSILEYLNYLLYHNKLFPNVQYDFFGFIGFSNSYPSITSAIPYIEPIVTQKYILGECATQDEIENYMLKIGFEKINEHTFKKDSYIVSDLRPRNVIKNSEGDIFVIDNIIKTQSKMKTGDSTQIFAPNDKSSVDNSDIRFRKGGQTKKQKKISKVMHEFKEGELKTHGKKVTDRKQAIAIALSEAKKYNKGGSTNCIDFAKNSQEIKNNGYFHYFSNTSIYADFQVPKVKSFYLITYNSGGQKNLKAIDTINSFELVNNLHNLIGGDKSISQIILSEFIKKAKRIEISNINKMSGNNIIIADRDSIVCENINYKHSKGDNTNWVDSLTFDEKVFCKFALDKFSNKKLNTDCNDNFDCLKSVDKQELLSIIEKIKPQLLKDGLELANSIIIKING